MPSPIYQGQIDALLKRLQALEDELKRVRRGITVLSGSVDSAINNGGGGTGTVHSDGSTITGNGTIGSPLSATPLSGTINARIVSLSGSIDSRINSMGGGSGTPDGHTLASVTGVLNAEPLSGTVNSGIVALSGTINARVFNLSGTIDGHFNALSSSFVNTIFALSGGTNLAVESYIWSGGRTTYQAGIPLIVGAFRFDPTTITTIIGSSASIYFLASAANNLPTVKSYAQLWNVSDGYQVATASFAGTTFVDQVIGLSVNGSGNLNIPNAVKDYEVRVFLSGTSGAVPNGASVELYSAGVKAILSGVMGGGGINNAFSGSIDAHFNALSGTINSAFVSTNASVTSLSGTVNARFNAPLTMSIAAADSIDPSNTHTRFTLGDGWSLAANTNKVVYPITLEVGMRITGYTLYIRKLSNALFTMSSDLNQTVGTTGGASSLSAVASNNTNAPGYVQLSVSGLAIDITAGRQYYLLLTPGGGGNEELHHLEVVYKRQSV